jgi:two-component system, OmpR family, phosphate regulon sensor histidine kinase PhoR
MKRNSLGFVIIMATFSVVGILLIQIFFLKNSYDLNEKQFHNAVTDALQNVALQISDYNSKVYGHAQKSNAAGEVEQISNNYYVVNVNDVIDPNLLEHFLTVEFKKQHLYMTFEYGIYDCNSKRMVYGNVLNNDSIRNYPRRQLQKDTVCCSPEEMMFEEHSQSHSKVENKKKKVCFLPTCEKFTYYFGVHFPDRSEYNESRLMTWYLLNGILFFVVIFFGYALYVIIKQRRLSEIQKNFINNLTHEFKTPIASIDLAAKVLANPEILKQASRMSDYVRIIDQQNKRLAAHVEKLLQMATIEKTKLILNLEKTELNSIITNSITEFKNSQNGNAYSINFESSIQNAEIMVDKLHFSNLIFNILDNAIKYCSVEPDILVRLDELKNRYMISFDDNGIGIPKAYRNQVFRRFYRVPTGNVHDVKGFGLGLDYVKKIVLRHGWHIEIAENSRKGSTFILYIKKAKL